MRIEVYHRNLPDGAKEHHYPIFGDEHEKISNARDLYI